MFSIVCVYNNEELLNSCLLSSLKKQSSHYDLVLVKNTDNTFSSAAEALNYGASLAKEDFLMFVHQDVTFLDPLVLENFQRYVMSLKHDSVTGVAGVKDECGVMTSIIHGDPPKPAGPVEVNSPEKCQTLDEVLIALPKRLFGKLGFDSKTCNGWHLYGADLCLSASSLGYDSFVIPANIYHRSSGYSMDKSYYKSLRKVIKKHKRLNFIYTTAGVWSTSRIKLELYLASRTIKSGIRNVLKTKSR